MKSITLPAAALIPTFNSLYLLQQWLRPGAVSFMIGAYIDALRSPAERLQAEREKLIAEMAKKYPTTYPEDYPDEKLRGQPHPKAGELMQEQVGGNIKTHFPTPEDAKLFAERDSELLKAEVDIQVPRLMTTKDLAEIEKNVSAKAEKDDSLKMPDMSLLVRFVNFETPPTEKKEP